ncbi:MAG: GntR family transcriptional regulator [Clostridiales bacterium]|nr:GntR family transcriptional regulator [Clostridiales bacterium]
MQDIKQAIVSGGWLPGGRIPSVRELALQYQVNPNTMQRALAELEREGLLYAERTAGRFVTKDGDRIAALRRETAGRLLQETFQQLASMGYTKEEIRRLMTEWEPGGEE